MGAGLAARRRADGGPRAPASGLTLFLAGDVMTGRGIDQVLPQPCDPVLHEPSVRDAREYVRLAEAKNGPIAAKPAPHDYVWGDALQVLAEIAPAVSVVNLETAVTARGTPWPAKGIHYRMHPRNAPCLAAAGIDVCVLANNHVLDWGYAGLGDTLDALAQQGLRTAGAGRDLAEAQAPAVVEGEAGRVLVIGLCTASSGVPADWAASEKRAGVELVELTSAAAARVAERIRGSTRPDDTVVVSIHWGGNWGHDVPSDHRRFAHALIECGADVVHGHSSHHPKGIEVHRGRLVLHGCGDFLNDYEGISGHEAYRPDLVLAYCPVLDASGALQRLVMAPLRIARFRLNRASAEESRWLAETLTRQGASFRTRVAARSDGLLELDWPRSSS
jgi:poly-gamma-glutamate synthesis protein (capsule biosynthesis protein)